MQCLSFGSVTMFNVSVFRMAPRSFSLLWLLIFAGTQITEAFVCGSSNKTSDDPCGCLYLVQIDINGTTEPGTVAHLHCSLNGVRSVVPCSLLSFLMRIIIPIFVCILK